MKYKIDNTILIDNMEQNNVKVVSVDTENMVYTCDDGNEYPLMDGMESLTIDELQSHIDNAKQTTINILKQIETENG